MLGSTAPKALSSERWLMPSGHCRATVGCLVSANQRHCNYRSMPKPLGFADGLKPEFSSGFSAFEPNLYQRQSSRRETQFSRAETKTPKRPLQFNGQIAETKCVHGSPPVRGYSQ